ncbi:DnaD domain-containing protein [Neobacillus mesonae]|nr:DnaD domain-containing protein [Neobacillus mesonae]
MSEPSVGTWADGVAYGMAMGSFQLPYALLRYYARLGLSEGEMLLIQHLLGFQQMEGNDFPTLQELADRMGILPDEIARRLQRLMKEGFIRIDEEMDEIQGIQYEHYNLIGLYTILAQCLSEDRSSHVSKPAFRGRTSESPLSETGDEPEEKNIFRIFEKEFGRPLSPMELERISSWIDQDRYPDELILLALKEAVFAGKIHFTYIDRILLEWSRNRVRTAQDVKAYAARFRNGGR